MAPLSLILSVVVTILLVGRVRMKWLALGAFSVVILGFVILVQGEGNTQPEGLAHGVITSTSLIGVFVIIMGLFSGLTLCVTGIIRALKQAARH